MRGPPESPTQEPWLPRDVPGNKMKQKLHKFTLIISIEYPQTK